MKVIIDGIEYVPALVFHRGDTRSLPVLLAEIRNALNWTLDEAAARIGCSKGTVCEMEKRRHMPSLPMAHRISRAYGVPLEILAAAALNEKS